jgi:hypothetical protein
VQQQEGKDLDLSLQQDSHSASSEQGWIDDDEVLDLSARRPNIEAAANTITVTASTRVQVCADAAVVPVDTCADARCAVFDRNIHSRMPLVPTSACLKRAGM